MDEKKEVSVYTRIPAGLDEALRITCARARISKPKAIAEAIRLWLKGKGWHPGGESNSH